MNEEETAPEKNEAARQLGRAGGEKTKKLYGLKHYQKLADHMNAVRRSRKLKKDLNKITP